MKSIKIVHLLPLALFLMFSCKSKPAETVPGTSDAKVTVKTTTLINGSIDDIISLNGKTVYLKKNGVVASIPGYIKKVYIQYGDLVHKNDLLFDIQTRENKALENSGIDPQLSSSGSGVISILAPSNGIIGELNINSSGVYVVEGSQLCSVTENQDLMVQVNVPYEYNRMIRINQGCKIILPDETQLDGNISKLMPLINETSQTQNVLIRMRGNRQLPENLNVIVQFIRSSHAKALLIPKAALLSNEIQQDFWVMKILNDSIALKMPVTKGYENKSMVEVLSPDLSLSDLIIIDGAYGLPDSTIVKVVK